MIYTPRNILKMLKVQPCLQPELKCRPGHSCPSCRAVHLAAGLTDKEDGEGDEEQEDVGHHGERVQEAAVVEHAPVHVVGARAIVIATECEGHGGTQTLWRSGSEEQCRRECQLEGGGGGKKRHKEDSSEHLNPAASHTPIPR